MRNLVIGTAGHIDHGKSTLVRALTGIDPDRLKEEKERGITIELGFAHAVIGETRVAFVDVPGHERFVRTMLAGVGGVDCVLLIVASDESVMPQTREHFDICRLLHVQRGIVVLTKSDLVDDETSELVRQDVAELVKGSFLEPAEVIAVSAATGDGLDRLREAIGKQTATVGERSGDGAARLPIDRAFSMKGFGTVVTGTLVSGRIAAGDELVVQPGDRPVTVRGVQVHGKAAAAAVAGQRAAINLGGVEIGEVSRGETLMAPATLSITRRVDAEIDLLPSAKPLKHGARIRLHNGTAEVLGRVSIAGTSTEVAAGDSALVRLRLETPAVLTRGDRFIVRAYSPPVTIGGGVVLDGAPTRPGVRTNDGLTSLERLRIDGESSGPIQSLIDAAGLPGLAVATLVARAGVAPGQIDGVTKALATHGIERVGDRVVAARFLKAAGERIVTLVTAAHQSNQMSEGLPREEAREKVFGRTAPAIFEKVLAELKGRHVVIGTERLALPTHQPTVVGADDRVRSAIVNAYLAGGLTPPDRATVEASAKAAAAVVEKVITLLLRDKTLIRLDTVVFHAGALAKLKGEVAALKASAPDGRATIDVAAFKEKYGVSRKFAIPLLEFLDRERVTRRTGDVRLVL